MSATAKPKTKEKSTPRAGKEQPKVSIKPSPVHVNGANSSASTYIPLLTAFHTLDIPSPSSSLPPQSNGRFRVTDDSEDHFGYTLAMAADCDCLSNNGSYSGESEDQKEKPTTSAAPRLESVPGSDNDKRDKIRQKNERKHQRQRERRAQDLHERSNAFLTSRKLDLLSHQLVSMGFPIDRATMAIIVNEGRMEESVAWLLQEGEEDGKHQASLNLDDKSRIKVDISDELAKVAEMETKYKCTRQDVERAVIACEGDLMKAENSLRVQKQAASAAATLKLVEFFDSNNSSNKVGAANHNHTVTKAPIKEAASVTFQQQQKLHEKDLTCSKAVVPQDSANRNLNPVLKKTQLPNMADWPRAQTPVVDKRWLAMNSSSSPLDLPLQVLGPSHLRPELQFAAPMAGHELKSNFQASALKEPFVVMRRPKQNLSPSVDMVSSSPSASAGWYSNANILTAANGGFGNHSMHQLYLSQSNLHPVPADFPSGAIRSSQLVVPASLGLFTDWSLAGSSNSSSHNDWNSRGLASHKDYTSIDWSLDLTPRRSLLKNDAPSDTWPAMRVGGNDVRPFANSAGTHIRGFEVPGGFWSGDPLAGPSSSSSHEWTNPFEGRDIFRIPRQYVASTSVEKSEFKMEK